MIIDLKEMPHGHGLSYKKGISDGILNKKEFEDKVPNGHDKSYKSGLEVGIKLKESIVVKV